VLVRTATLFVLALGIAWAAPSAAQLTRSASPGHVSPPASLEDLSWLAGEWLADGITGPAREVYSPPMGGTIAGHFVQSKGDGIMFYEIMTIAQVGPTITYRLKHFHPDLKGWEERDEVREFRFVGRDGDTWYFDGLTISRIGPDQMHGTVKIAQTGKELTFKYRRQR
jgi:hypothetical protein